jgi:hypothetical protein
MRRLEPDPEFESHVRHTLGFLFVEHEAKLVSNQRLPGTGNAQLFIRVLNMDLRIIQKEGSLSVLASPGHSSSSWQSIESLLMAIDPNGKFPPPPVYGSLTELSRLLEPRLLSLNDALSTERFASTVQDARQSRIKGMIALTPRTPVRISPAKRVLIGAVRGIARTIRFLTPTSKDRYSKFLPIGSDDELEEKVRQEFDTLFKRFGAHITSNGRLRIMDFAYVTFDAGNLRVRASRDRGSVDVSIAPIHSVRDWHSLGVALLAIQEDCGSPKSVPSSILRGAGRRLETEFVRLNEAFSEPQYPVIRERIRELSENLKEEWLEEFNKKANSYRATVS